MERLTEKIGGDGYLLKMPENKSVSDLEIKWKVYDKLGAYEDAEEQGVLLRLPYPLGTKHLYFVDKKDVDVYKLNAEKIEVHISPASKKIVYTVDTFDFDIGDFGRIAFLTKEEAEQALKQMGELDGQYDEAIEIYH